MEKLQGNILRRFTGANAQLFLLIGIIFIIPLFNPSVEVIAYNIGFTLLLITTAYSLQTKRKTVIILIAVALIALEWLSTLLQFPILHDISQISKGLYFIGVVVLLIRQTAIARRVTEQVIVDAISGYLLLGMVFTIGTLLINNLVPGAYNFAEGPGFSENVHMNDYIYYTFTTFTTTGYGDLLPILPMAKSFSIFTAASGQLYIATIISLLIGKYAASAMNKD